MTSVASDGTTERIVARVVVKVVRAGSGTPARYSSILFGTSLVFSAALRRAGFVRFTKEDYKNFNAHEDFFFTEGNEANEGRTGLFHRVRPVLQPLRFLRLSSVKKSSSLSFARGAQVLAFLMQHHGDYFTGPIAFEIKLGIQDLIEEIVGCAGIDRNGGLPG